MDASNGAWRSLVILKEGDGIDIMIPVARSLYVQRPDFGAVLGIKPDLDVTSARSAGRSGNEADRAF